MKGKSCKKPDLQVQTLLVEGLQRGLQLCKVSKVVFLELMHQMLKNMKNSNRLTSNLRLKIRGDLRNHLNTLCKKLILVVKTTTKRTMNLLDIVVVMLIYFRITTKVIKVM